MPFEIPDLLHESIPLYQEQSEEGNTFSADNLFQYKSVCDLLADQNECKHEHEDEIEEDEDEDEDEDNLTASEALEWIMVPSFSQEEALNMLAHIPETIMNIIQGFVYRTELPSIKTEPISVYYSAKQFSGLMRLDKSTSSLNPYTIMRCHRWEAVKRHLNNEMHSFTWIEVDEYLRSKMFEEFSQSEKEEVTMGDLRAAVGSLGNDNEYKMDIALLVEFLELFTDEKDMPLVPELKLSSAQKY